MKVKKKNSDIPIWKLSDYDYPISVNKPFVVTSDIGGFQTKRTTNPLLKKRKEKNEANSRSFSKQTILSECL